VHHSYTSMSSNEGTLTLLLLQMILSIDVDTIILNFLQLSTIFSLDSYHNLNIFLNMIYLTPVRRNNKFFTIKAFYGVFKDHIIMILAD
jgi:hypothetical protein